MSGHSKAERQAELAVIYPNLGVLVCAYPEPTRSFFAPWSSILLAESALHDTSTREIIILSSAAPIINPPAARLSVVAVEEPQMVKVTNDPR